MRISTNLINTSGLNQILDRQNELRQTQLQLSTQKRFLTPADDPVAATSVLDLRSDIAQLEQFNRNASFAESNNTLEESVLIGVNQIMFRMNELMVQLGNGAFTPTDLNSIKVEMEQQFDELLGLANTRDSAGDYLFSGFSSSTIPFTRDGAGNVVYNGDQGQRLLRVSTGVQVPISDSGFEVFEDIFNGNGKFTVSANAANTGEGWISPQSFSGAGGNFVTDSYEIRFTSATAYDVVRISDSAVIQSGTFSDPDDITFANLTVRLEGDPATGDVFRVDPAQKQSIFQTFDQLIDGINNYQDTPQGRAQFRTLRNNLDGAFVNATERIDVTRGRIGSRLNATQQEFDFNSGLVLANKTTLSELEDLDVIEAASRLSQQTAVLDAAQSSYVRIQNLTVFRFL
ncbi:flagellar hook-associated protein FlgL [Pleionea sp. CnH1-48]|uniref:flagellar hook-associated protein FlgL n=1 Tax=Pleionea sp. CnH1-48 TaxID=2954494 RepID=UPI0020976517|nr:flagellar hook-associated protein FlgL [Pleionea sp. CnH1-48]MCO7226151.1 flagellar hook-associated protein FlgL [Pleionea sp. CnH1-48]